MADRREALKRFGLGSVALLFGAKMGESEKEPSITSLSGQSTSGVVASDALTIVVDGQVYEVLMRKKV